MPTPDSPFHTHTPARNSRIYHQHMCTEPCTRAHTLLPSPYTYRRLYSPPTYQHACSYMCKTTSTHTSTTSLTHASPARVHLHIHTQQHPPAFTFPPPLAGDPPLCAHTRTCAHPHVCAPPTPPNPHTLSPPSQPPAFPPHSHARTPRSTHSPPSRPSITIRGVQEHDEGWWVMLGGGVLPNCYPWDAGGRVAAQPPPPPLYRAWAGDVHTPGNSSSGCFPPPRGPSYFLLDSSVVSARKLAPDTPKIGEARAQTSREKGVHQFGCSDDGDRASWGWVVRGRGRAGVPADGYPGHPMPARYPSGMPWVPIRRHPSPPTTRGDRIP